MAENQGCLVATNFVSVLAYYYFSSSQHKEKHPLAPNYSPTTHYIPLQWVTHMGPPTQTLLVLNHV